RAMNRTAFWASVAGGAVAVIFLAGFFHAEKSPEAEARRAPLPCLVEESALKYAGRSAPVDVYAAAEPAAPAPRGLLALTSTPGYKRAGELSLRVEDCTKAEDTLESKLT